MPIGGATRRARHGLEQRYRRYRTEWALHRRVSGTQPVLVYSLGKVGTTSLLHLLESELGTPVVHCHEIAKEPSYEESPLGSPADTTRHRSPVVWRGTYMRRRLERDTEARWDIVCGVRDPVARHVSALFHVGDRYRLLDASGDRSAEVERLTELIGQQVLHGDIGLDWFDTELRAMTGIDVYATPFDCDAGYEIYEQGRFRVLLIRFRDLNRVGPEALSRFFSIDVDEIPRDNVGSEKSYSELYDEFRRQAVLPHEALDAAYGSRLARHFYTEDELAADRAHWTERA